MVNGSFAMDIMMNCQELAEEGIMTCKRVRKTRDFGLFDDCFDEIRTEENEEKPEEVTLYVGV